MGFHFCPTLKLLQQFQGQRRTGGPVTPISRRFFFTVSAPFPWIYISKSGSQCRGSTSKNGARWNRARCEKGTVQS